jgi:acetolactate synthase-1/2/3 large subunit
MRVCDWIAEYLYNQGINRVHGLMGGGASGLNDGFIKQGKISYICYHNEQGAGHSAVGEAKFTGQLAVVNPTTGCAGTNCITSVLDAWQDSVPVLFLSGNVKLNTCSGWINQTQGINLRKYGVQEHHIVDTVKSITKMSYFITSPNEVAKVIQEAMYVATTGRPGPVWIDIPGNIQTSPMSAEFETFNIPEQPQSQIDIKSVIDALEQSQRPLVVAGDGIRQSRTVNYFVRFVEKYKLPFVTTYGGRDITSNDYSLNVGPIGVRGSRAGNFALQNADLLLILGTSLSSGVVGYDPAQFSPFSYKIVVDCDSNELEKNIIHMDQKHQLDLQDFFGAML